MYCENQALLLNIPSKEFVQHSVISTQRHSHLDLLCSPEPEFEPSFFLLPVTYFKSHSLLLRLYDPVQTLFPTAEARNKVRCPLYGLQYNRPQLSITHGRVHSPLFKNTHASSIRHNVACP